MLLIILRILSTFFTGTLLTSPFMFMGIHLSDTYNLVYRWELNLIVWGILILVFIVGWSAGKQDRYLRKN